MEMMMLSENKQKVKYIIIDLVNDLKYVENLKINLGNQNIQLFDSLDDYLSDNHMKKDKNIKSFHDLYYDDYMSKTETLLIITNNSKKEWKKLTKNINEKTFYPIRKIKIISNISIDKILLKIKSSINIAVDNFYFKYNQNISFKLISKNIAVCPYCRANNFKVINDIDEYEKDGKSINDIGVFGYFGLHLTCSNCHKSIRSKTIMLVNNICQ